MLNTCSAVTIIVVTIFIAILQNYRIVSLSRYFLCVRNDIFAWHLRYASTIDSPPVYSSFSMLQSRAANDVTHMIAALRLWLSSVSIRERRRNCLWSNVSQGGLRGPSHLYDITTHNYQHVYMLWLSSWCTLFSLNWKLEKSISLCTGLNTLSVYKTKVHYKN